MKNETVLLALGTKISFSTFARRALTVDALTQGGEQAAIIALMEYWSNPAKKPEGETLKLLIDENLLNEQGQIPEDVRDLLPYLVTIDNGVVYAFRVMKTPEEELAIKAAVKQLNQLELNELYAHIYMGTRFTISAAHTKVEKYLINEFPLPELKLEICRQYYQRLAPPMY